MTGSPKKQPRKPSQSERFMEAAREVETDDSPEEFERVFGKIVPAKKAGDIAAPSERAAKRKP